MTRPGVDSDAGAGTVVRTVVRTVPRPRWSWASTASGSGQLHAAATADAQPGSEAGSLCGDVVVVTDVFVEVGDLNPCLSCLGLLHLIGGSGC